jgi:DNA polymerase III epsilon subunit-like protein
MQIATFDLETSSLKANFGVVLCGVFKPIGGECRVARLDDFTDKWSEDRDLIATLITELSSPLILVAHNGVRFDRPFLNARATRWGLAPLNPRGRIIDPVVVARRHFAMSWNGLESLSVFLQTEHRKHPVDGGLWLRAILDHDKFALDEIVEHCVNDVMVLEEVVERLQPFVGKVQEWGSA